MAHTAPKTHKSFTAFCNQKSSEVLWAEDNITMLRRPNSTQQWDWNGTHWVLAGFS